MSFLPVQITYISKENDGLSGAKVNLKGNEVFLASSHFDRQQNISVMKALLKQSLLRVHVEVSAFCNRRCGFCPNTNGSRINNKQLLPETIYLRILQDLQEISYDKLFGFHQYNEPLADRIILTRIAQARKFLPDSPLVIHSNGDYLDRDYLEALADAGLTGLNISIYGPNNGEFIDSYILGRMNALAKKLDLSFEMKIEKPRYRYLQAVEFRSMKVQLMAMNYWDTGYNRGELVEAGPQLKRTSPCFYPFQDLTVDWRGNILPCCNVYPDSPEHTQWVTGNLSDGRSIFEHYADSDLVEWRRNLIRFYPKGSPCESCSRLEHPELASPENINVMDQLANELIKTDQTPFCT
ncbi:hypothetical protein C7B61_02045 [filamentous cyanobacterium CCP1]|nr:hypothetical protein C7B76_15535 [filamentous cyanobacterium CCP2]PSB68217.1 hypothetical protein C7B61_02045 [filamentous cyanobacterium CCP1]